MERWYALKLFERDEKVKELLKLEQSLLDHIETTNLAVEELQKEIDEIHKKIAELELILSDENVLRELIKSELREVSDKYGDARRTTINYAAGEFTRAWRPVSPRSSMIRTERR